MKNIRALNVLNHQITELDSERPITDQTDGGVSWVHCEGDLDDVRAYLNTQFDIPGLMLSALCDEYTRPRNLVDENDDLLVTLRTIVLDSEQGNYLASLRCWVSESLIISVSKQALPVVNTLFAKYQGKAKGIRLGHHILWDLGRIVVEQLTDYISSIDAALDQLEDEWESSHDLSDTDKLHQIRLEVSHARRYLSPQLDAFIKVSGVVFEHHSDAQERELFRSRWKELANSIKRDMETTTEMRERVIILKDALQQKTNETTNKIMFLLSVVATFFLPLTFIASLMGMNVKGMPAEDSDMGFWLTCGVMGLVALIQWLLFKRWKWLR